MSELVNAIRAVSLSRPAQSLEGVLESKPIASRAAIGAAAGFATSLAFIAYVDFFHPEQSAEVRKLIEYQAPTGWQGALVISSAYAAAASGAASVVGLLKYLTRK